MTVMMEAIGAELALRAALNEVVKHIASAALDANLRELEGEAARIADARMREGFVRAITSIQRDRK